MRHTVSRRFKLREVLLVLIAALLIAGAVILWLTVAAAKN